MQDKIKDLWHEIEHLRSKLHEIVELKGFSAPETIRLSQELDAKLDEYSRVNTLLRRACCVTGL